MRCKSFAGPAKHTLLTKKPARVQKDVKIVATVQGKPTLWNRLTKFIRGVRSEMRKVSWPNRQELITYTIVVIATIIIVMAFTSLVDVIVTWVLNLLGSLGR